jgi:hypothetical protein
MPGTCVFSRECADLRSHTFGCENPHPSASPLRPWTPRSSKLFPEPATLSTLEKAGFDQSSRHSPGTLGTAFLAPRHDSNVCDRCLSGRGGLVYYRMIFDTAAMLDQNANERRARAYSRPMTRPGDVARAWRDVGLIDVVQDTLTIRMEFASFADFWAPAEGKDGPVADYVGTLSADAKAKLRDAVELAYLDGEADGARSYAATAWVVKGEVPT